MIEPVVAHIVAHGTAERVGACNSESVPTGHIARYFEEQLVEEYEPELYLLHMCGSDVSAEVMMGRLGTISLGPKPDFHFGRAITQLVLSGLDLGSGDLSADRIRKALSTINTQVGPMLTTFGIDAKDLVVRFHESNIAAAATAASSTM